jgi:cytochrome c-type biogenesis protein
MNGAGFALAFGAGVLSITSPCCLPLLPGYLGYLTGLTPVEVRQRRGRTFVAALLFVLGFTAVFVALGATASEVGAMLASLRIRLYQLAGIFILLIGGLILLEGRLGILGRGGDWSQNWARGQLWAALPLGAAFAISWTPCIGPVLGAILTMAGSTADLAQGVMLLAVYSLGLGVPFLALSLSVDPVRGWLRRFGRGAALLRTASGAVLVLMGFLLVSNRWLQVISPALAWYAQFRWPPV